MTREEREAAIAYIKEYRKLDEDLHNAASKDSISYYATDKCLKYWDMAIKALEQEPCEDAISREAVRQGMLKYGFTAPDMTVHEFVEDELSSVQPSRLCDSCRHWEDRCTWLPSRRKGKWIKKDYWKPLPLDASPLDFNKYDEKTHSEIESRWFCSECDFQKGKIKPIAKFCENCGAEMESDE